MEARQPSKDDQATLWNGLAGHAWVELQEILDHMFKPLENLLVEAVAAAPGKRVLDVGCGSGGTTLAVAHSLGAGSFCTGIDISEPMITAARARAEREGVKARFICANAQNHPFEPGSVDMLISRFGVMFFDEPAAAFTNLRNASSESGKLRLIAWRSAAENPFMTTAERAAAPLLPDLPVRRPDAPGQFAFADRLRVHSILEESGWTSIDIQPIDVTCRIQEKELIPYLTRLGPVGQILYKTEEGTRRQIVETVRAAFDPYVKGTEVRFTAACWMVGARAMK